MNGRRTFRKQVRSENAAQQPIFSLSGQPAWGSSARVCHSSGATPSGPGDDVSIAGVQQITRDPSLIWFQAGIIAAFLLYQSHSSVAQEVLWKERLEGFVNRSDAYPQGLYLTISNYAPVFVFRDREAYNTAVKDLAVTKRMKATQVTQLKLFANFSRTNLYYNAQKTDVLDSRAFTNRNGTVFGRKSSEWWMEQRYGFQVLQDSDDGMWFDTVAQKTNRFFAELYKNSTEYFQLCLADVGRGSFEVHGALDDGSMTWMGLTEGGEYLRGSVRPDGQGVIIELPLIDSGRTLLSKVVWDDVNQVPEYVELKLRTPERSVPLRTYHFRGFVEEPAPRSSDRVFEFSAHTNAGDVIMLVDKHTGVRKLLGSGKVVAQSPRPYPSHVGKFWRKTVVLSALGSCSILLVLLLVSRNKKTRT